MKRKSFYIAIALLVAFGVWTAAVCLVDVSPIGPGGSSVGFAALNGWFHRLTGAHMALYNITDWLGLVPIAVAFGFAVLGAAQWIKRKKLFGVDKSILMLGVFYVAVISAYVLFEFVTVNFRPILINGILETSYPSSTTVLVMCVMPTSIIQLRERIKNKALRWSVTLIITLFSVFMVVGRMLSGVHWLSDIIGGALLSSGLVMAYYSLSDK